MPIYTSFMHEFVVIKAILDTAASRAGDTSQVEDKMRVHITVTGEIQGVGFRPFIYRVAKACGLSGWVANTLEGVEIEWEGPEASIEAGLQTLRARPPAISTIKAIRVRKMPSQCAREISPSCETFSRCAAGNAAIPSSTPENARTKGFVIRQSQIDRDRYRRAWVEYVEYKENSRGNRRGESRDNGGLLLIMPDIGLCDDCRMELLSPGNRRFRHPFISCTYCGPRFTIISGVPYDREKTSMSRFELCGECRREYEDPGDRRYHAQTVACHGCGPRLEFIAPHLEAGPSLSPVTPGTGPTNQGGNHIYGNHSDPCHTTDTIDAIDAAVELLAAGKVVAVKGIGGYHLACNAMDESAVRLLRERKQREDEPFAVMMKDIDTVRRYCHVSPEEEKLLLSWERPIALITPKAAATGGVSDASAGGTRVGSGADTDAGASAGAGTGSRGNRTGAAGEDSAAVAGLAPNVSGRSRYLGVMLPYTPVHELLLAHTRCPEVLVMTSANRHEEPMIYGSDPGSDAPNSDSHNSDDYSCDDYSSDGRPDSRLDSRLGTLACGILTHDRPILRRCDDSVVRVQSGRPVIIRRSRGYVPRPVPVCTPARHSGRAPAILAMGGHMKNAFCIAKGDIAIPSQYIGDLESREAQREYEIFIVDFLKLFRFRPELIACDLHSGYYSTRHGLHLAREWGIPVVRIQHHHAHIASCLVENGISGSAIGVAFDGTGLGCDGQLWGGEFLFYSPCRGGSGNHSPFAPFDSPFVRWAHLSYIPMPGGEKAIREPWRMAAAYAALAIGEDISAAPLPFRGRLQDGRWGLLWRATTEGLKDGRTLLTSSVGRLFDAISALIGLRETTTYEGQAAVELESEAVNGYGYGYGYGPEVYPYAISGAEGDIPWTIDVMEMIREIMQEMISGVPRARIARKFHHTLATIIVDVCRRIRKITSCNTVALSGGVFQNELLLSDTLSQLEGAGFTAHIHHLVSTNDQGISLGQAILASAVAGTVIARTAIADSAVIGPIAHAGATRG
ncbi:MAG: carbamoyltransferase HypF [Firmicutes bacterium]|nr:carbamoyltransferase HypF [Bacillota bacterium]